MSGVWLFIVPVGVIALVLVLRAVRDVSRSIGTLVESMQELSDAGVGLTKIREELAAQRSIVDDIPPQ